MGIVEDEKGSEGEGKDKEGSFWNSIHLFDVL